MSTVYQSNQTWQCDFCAGNNASAAVQVPLCVLCNEKNPRLAVKSCVDVMSKNTSWCHLKCQEWHPEIISEVIDGKDLF